MTIHDEFTNQDLSTAERTRLRRRRDGLCVRCRRPSNGRFYCERCNESSNMAHERYRMIKRAKERHDRSS